MGDISHPTPPSGSRLKGNTLRLASAVLVGLLIMLVTGLIGTDLKTAAIMSVICAVVFWLAWLVFVRLWMRFAHRHS